MGKKPQLLEAEKKSTLEEGGGPVRKDQFPFLKKIQKKIIQKPTGEFESVNRLSSDSGQDIDEVKRAGGVVKDGEGRDRIPFCVDEIRHQHFAVDFPFFFLLCSRWCLVRVRVKDGRGEAEVS